MIKKLFSINISYENKLRFNMRYNYNLTMKSPFGLMIPHFGRRRDDLVITSTFCSSRGPGWVPSTGVWQCIAVTLVPMDPAPSCSLLAVGYTWHIVTQTHMSEKSLNLYHFLKCPLVRNTQNTQEDREHACAVRDHQDMLTYILYIQINTLTYYCKILHAESTFINCSS